MTTPYHHHYYEDNRGYVTPLSDNHHHYTDNSNNKNNEEEVIFSLTERLREKEDEVRHLRQENSELENQLILQGNLPIKLDTAYEELLAHLKQREEDFKLASTKYEERQRELERENRKLKDKVHASRKIMDEQEHNMALVERETEDELKIMRQQMENIMANSAVSRDLEQENHKLKERVHASRQLLEEQEQNISMIGREAGEELKLMQQQLDSAMKEIDEKDRQIVRLEDMIQRQSIDADRYKKQETEDKALLARLGERVENCRYEQGELESENDELQRRVQTQHHLLKEKEDELIHMERFRDQREDELNDDIDRMRHRFNEVITSQRMVLDDREEQIQLLYRQIDRYDDICEEADWVTKEQRSALKANKKEIEELSQAIDRVQNSGLLSQLDNMCTGKVDSSGNSSLVGT